MSEHVDVLIVGAGISGLDAAHHLRERLPGRSFVILDTMETYGGTWHTHRYPGVRSDSDLYTFGYKWKPWSGPPIATAEEIQAYLAEVIRDDGLDPHIRFRHKVISADWSDDERQWHVTVERLDEGDIAEFTAGFVWMCQGYYRHDKGYTPDWTGFGDYQGTVVHPQHWPDDLDYAGKQVLVIGSGATAATLVPAMAATTGHITVLQRSPTYFWSAPNSNELADTLRELDVDPAWIHEIVRRKLLLEQETITRLAFDEPEFLATELINGVAALLPEGYDVATHFTPKYLPWRQRLALVPDGDMFKGISDGLVTMVTDEIDTFTPTGVRTKSGQQLDADIVITATGFDLCMLGDVDVTVNGDKIDFADTVTYRGMMFTGVPNLSWVFGYFRASWTLRADLISDLMCRLFEHMDGLGATVVTPQLRPEDADMALGAWVDEDSFNPGYLVRGQHLMPRRGNKPEWQHTQDYWNERNVLPAADLDDGCLIFR